MSDDADSDRDPLDTYDTPTRRATISQVDVDALDDHLERIRARRLVLVKQLQSAANVRADSVRLGAFLKLERALAVARRAMIKLEEQDARAAKVIHKCRLLALAARLEVDATEEEEEVDANQV